MADPPAVRNKSSDLTEKEQTIAHLLFQGWTPAQIAKHLHPEDKKARKAERQRIWNKVRDDARIATAVGQDAKVQMILGLGPATKALTKRAARGRPDAIKLLYEASGLHNPKVKHEHSGDIKISLDIPRPKPAANQGDEDPEVVDAEVVDD